MKLPAEDELTKWLKNEISNKSDAHYRKKDYRIRPLLYSVKKGFLMENFLALLSIAFQLSGAILLMVKFWGKRKEEILQQYFNSSESICRDDGEEVVLRKEKLQKIFKEIYLTRFSFVYIVLGYLLSVFDLSISKCCAILAILLISSILILFAFSVSTLICRTKYSKDLKILYDEAVEKGNATQIMSKEEVEEIIDSLD